MSEHDLNTNEDYWRDEISGIIAPFARRNRWIARWELVWKMWKDGRTPAQIGKWIGRSESTATYLLKRSFKRRMTLPGFTWPKDNQGRFICDIPHPCSRGYDHLDNWNHIRMRHGYCSVCRSQLNPKVRSLATVRLS